MDNPFFHRGPVRHAAFFFDRKVELQRIATFIRSGQSVSLVGPRRIGKTSLLLQLMTLITAQDEQRTAAVSPPPCVAFLDCQAWAHITSAELYARVASALADTTSHAEIGATTTLCDVERLVRAVMQTGRRVVFLVDEFDALRTNAQVSDALCGLRSLAMAGGVSYVVATIMPLQAEPSEQSNEVGGAAAAPFFNFFAQMHLGLFTRDEAANMLAQLSARGGQPFTPALIEWLIGLAGCHPLYLQIAGDCAFDCLSAYGAIDADDADARERIRQNFLDEVASHWRYAWNSLTEDEQRVLAALPLRCQSAPLAVQRLEHAGLVVRERGSNVGATWVSHEWRTFAGRQPVHGLKQIPPITLDEERHAVLARGELVDLPPSEFDLLARLMEANGQIVPHGELEKWVWEEGDVEGGERLKSTVKSLRRCLGDAAACIDNVRGVGYRFNRLCD